MFRNNCPLCGTGGKTWHKEPEAFICPRCLAVFTQFGIILQSESQEEASDDLVSSWS